MINVVTQSTLQLKFVVYYNLIYDGHYNRFTYSLCFQAGYRLIDCACDYGNEVEVGQGIKKAIDEGIVTREVG